MGRHPNSQQCWPAGHVSSGWLQEPVLLQRTMLQARNMLQIVPAGSYWLVGQLALLPLQVSSTSHDPASARQT